MGCCAASPKQDAHHDAVATASNANFSISDLPKQNGQQHSAEKPQTANMKIDAANTTEAGVSSNTPYTPLSADNGDGVDFDTLDARIRAEQLEAEQKFEHEKKQEIRDGELDTQITRYQSQEFVSMYQVFQMHALGVSRDIMDIDGLADALATFGLVIKDKQLKRLVFNTFYDEDDGVQKKEIDFNDFSAGMASIMHVSDEDQLLLIFQIFDLDDDGYLELHDMTRVLLALNQIAVAVMGAKDQQTKVFTKRQCLKQSKKVIAKHGFDEEKISFPQFKTMLMNRTEKELFMQNLPQPSTNFDAPMISMDMDAISNSNR